MRTTNLGFPNVYNSLIKRSVEGFWSGKKTALDVEFARHDVLRYNAAAQAQLDLRQIFDTDIYDRMLRTAVMFGITPQRFGSAKDASDDLRTYLSIPRGTDAASASPMVKWFNTNYHVVQPEIERDPEVISWPRTPELGVDGTSLALLGPWTLLSYALNKTSHSKEDMFRLLAEQYATLINSLPQTTVQLEEPSFITDGMPDGYEDFLAQLRAPIHLHTYFGAVTPIADRLFAAPVAGIGLDFIDGPQNLDALLRFPADKTLIAGVINGRNVWPATTRTKEVLERIRENVPDDRLYISPSCSLQHVPLSAIGEKGDFAFALEKLAELEAIKAGTITYRPASSSPAPLPQQRYARSRTTLWVSPTPYPTTTIGSFPQTPEVRGKRSQWQQGALSDAAYGEFIRKSVRECIEGQERLGLDVLVHGEFERADMVQYFAENLEGFVPIKGAVQSYGTRHVRPPVITGSVRRRGPFTVPIITYAQSLTKKPVKGMLTGPVTIVQWSFPREDVSREAQFYDVAHALAEEVDDLAAAGIEHIQIDEPALREGLPVEVSLRAQYLLHAVNAFRRVYAGVPDNVVIHSHMCFSEFPDILDAIKDMGVDVLSIEDSKAKGKTGAALRHAGFPGSVGLGVYDVHSPRLPTVNEMVAIPAALPLDACRIWINPDCGLKTRGQEAWAQLERMMEAARRLRSQRP